MVGVAGAAFLLAVLVMVELVFWLEGLGGGVVIVTEI